jgi:hypothetical protein
LFVCALFVAVGITFIRIGKKRARAAKPMTIRPCPDCGYELAGLDEPKRCPECSYELNPELIPIPGWGPKARQKFDPSERSEAAGPAPADGSPLRSRRGEL